MKIQLTDAPIWQRDGASATVVGNATNAQASWFADTASGNLHLLASARAAIDQAATLADVPDDYDGDTRPIGSAPDVGADEYGTPGHESILSGAASSRRAVEGCDLNETFSHKTHPSTTLRKPLRKAGRGRQQRNSAQDVKIVAAARRDQSTVLTRPDSESTVAYRIIS